MHPPWEWGRYPVCCPPSTQVAKIAIRLLGSIHVPCFWFRLRAYVTYKLFNSIFPPKPGTNHPSKKVKSRWQMGSNLMFSFESMRWIQGNLIFALSWTQMASCHAAGHGDVISTGMGYFGPQYAIIESNNHRFWINSTQMNPEWRRWGPDYCVLCLHTLFRPLLTTIVGLVLEARHQNF